MSAHEPNGSLLLSKAIEIAACLPGDAQWQSELRSPQACWLRRKSDGLTVSLFQDWKGRLTCRPLLPMLNGTRTDLRSLGLIAPNQEPPRCGLSFERSAEGIARDIARKVLAPYEEVYPQVLKVIADRLAVQAEAAETAQYMVDVLAARPQRHSPGDHHHIYLYGGDNQRLSGHITVYPYNQVKMELSNLTGEQARVLAQAIAQLPAI